MTCSTSFRKNSRVCACGRPHPFSSLRLRFSHAARFLMPGLLVLSLFQTTSASCFGYGHDGANFSSRNRYILEQYELKELALSGARKKQGKTQLCFQTPSGAYVTTFVDDYAGKDYGMIVKIRHPLQVVILEKVEMENGDWIERETLIELSPQARCNWKNSIKNREMPTQDFSGFR